MNTIKIKEHEEEAKRYIETKEANIKKIEINGLTAGVVFAESNISELGNVICENNPDIDFAMIINIDKSISFRTVKDNVDVSEIARSLNGGGHKKAAGAPILEDIKDRFIIDLMKKRIKVKTLQSTNSSQNIKKENMDFLIAQTAARGKYKSKYGKVDDNFKTEHFTRDKETGNIIFKQ